jgi:hypothetical protein
MRLVTSSLFRFTFLSGMFLLMCASRGRAGALSVITYENEVSWLAATEMTTTVNLGRHSCSGSDR